MGDAARDRAAGARPGRGRPARTVETKRDGPEAEARYAALREALALATAPRDSATAWGAEDDYGLDLDFRDKVLPAVKFLFDAYWRVSLVGIDNIPAKGPAILVGNHSGGLPFDGAMVAYAISRYGKGRVARPLYARFVEKMGPVADMYRKCGAAPARYTVADELLSRGELLVNFPEGVDGIGKLYADRYQLRSFSTSAARLAMRHRVPIVPFAVIGAEEIYPVIGRSEQLGKALGAPFIPVTPFFPFLGVAGLVPLPTKWTIAFGKRIHLYREKRFAGASVLDFDAMTARLRRTVEVMVGRHLAERSSIFLG